MLDLVDINHENCLICVCICVDIHAYIYIHIYTYIFTYMCVYMCMCMYVYKLLRNLRLAIHKKTDNFFLNK